MEPAIRNRRIAVTRERGRHRLRVAVAGLCVAAVVVAGYLVLHSGVFSARHVTVSGAFHTPLSTIVTTAGLVTDPPLIDVDPGQASARLEKLPWVNTASVERRWPDSVIVKVSERVAVSALARPSGGVAVLDASGRVLADETAVPAGVIPLVLSVDPPPPGSALGAAASGALTVVRDLPAPVRTRVQSVTEGSGGQMMLDLNGGIRADLGSASQLGAKFEALESVLAGATLSGREVIDLSVPEEPTVSPGVANGAGVVSTGPA
jgi:cell division protein FtsQ